MICARCDKPIRPGQKYEPVDKFSASGAGSTLYVHAVWCQRTPRQTAPASPRRAIRR